MKTLNKLLITAIVTVILIGCSQSHKSESTEWKEEVLEESYEESYDEYDPYDSYEAEESVPQAARSKDTKTATTGVQEGRKDVNLVISSSAATDLNIDPSRKIIRTADVKFRVDNVASATYDIEQIVAKTGGWVTYSNLVSEKTYLWQTAISEDSSIVMSKYVVKNTIIIRTPWQKLDTTLKALVPLIDYLDYRVIKAEDVTFSILAEKLKQKRLADYNARMKRYAETKNSTMSEITYAEQQILAQQEQADNSLIEELKQEDNIQFSTITIEIYETEQFEQRVIPNPEEIKEYKPGFGKRLLKALNVGWIIIQEVILAIISLWSIFLLGFGIYYSIRFIIKYFRNKRKNRKVQ